MEKLKLPNLRDIFIPDPGKVWITADLAGADAQVVAWEAEDDDLKAAFRAGLDVHSKNASEIELPNLGLGKKYAIMSIDDPKRKELRQKSKVGVHATNYLVSAKVLAASNNWLVGEAELFKKHWLGLHPRIYNWHQRIERELATRMYVRNAFGYARRYYDRPEDCLPEALAWLPQSTVALTTYRGALSVEADPELMALDCFYLQVHDSLEIQLDKQTLHLWLPRIADALHVQVPYPDPLTIPWELKRSDTSWGTVRKCDKHGKYL